MDKMSKAKAKAEARILIDAAVTNAQAAKGCVRKALALVGRNDAGQVVVSAVGRARLALVADAKIDANPSSKDVSDLASCYRSAEACFAMARRTGILAF